MTHLTSILCAVDDSPVAPRVLRHAVGFAAVTGARLTVMAVTRGDSASAHDRLAALVSALGPLPPGVGVTDLRVVKLALGEPADSILHAARAGVDLLVIGTRARAGVTRWLLGSTSAAVLAEAPCPTLLVPPGSADIVAFEAAGARLDPTAVLLALDLAEHNDRQVAAAADVAALAHVPLVVLGVAAPGEDPAAVEQALAAPVGALSLTVPTHVVVRQGAVAAEIDHAAVAAHAGLVVMGLRDRGLPGEIASAVAARQDAIVLAVPPARR